MRWSLPSSAVVLLAWITLLTETSALCTGRSDSCPANPSSNFRSNPINYHVETCNFKWTQGCTSADGQQQKPPAFALCTALHKPSGLLPIDAYTFTLQQNDFSPGSSKYTLHGLWPGSQGGRGSKNQPYGCENGEEFDDSYLSSFETLLQYFWPTNSKYNNTMECFILSEWMKHGTCAVVPGADGAAFRLPQEAYYRTAFVMANEYNENPTLQSRLEDEESLVSTSCVQCAYLATVGWTDNTVESVPRMSSDCIDQCFACGDTWSTCPPANLDSTVMLDNTNAPMLPSTRPELTDRHPEMAFAMSAMSSETLFPATTSPWQGTWRSFGAEQHGSGKFEFAQTFTEDTLTTTTDSPYPGTCQYDLRSPREIVLHDCSPNHHMEDCLVQRLPDIGDLEVSFFACNHTGTPAPLDFYAAMDTRNCGNFLMFRCKSSSGADCDFSPVTATNATGSAQQVEASAKPKERCPMSPSQPGIAGAPPVMLGSWRSLQVSRDYQVGMARWNFTSNGQASLEWPNYPSRGIEHYAVSHSEEKQKSIFLAGTDGSVVTCVYQTQYHPVYTYALLDCDQTDSVSPSDTAPRARWVMGRCNPCDLHCSYSCGPENDNCGFGSCDSARSITFAQAAQPRDEAKISVPAHNWCTPEDSSCWPTNEEIEQLEQELNPEEPRLGLQWNGFPQPQPAPVPTGSDNNQSFYGLGSTPSGLKALYHYDDMEEMKRPCFTAFTDPKTFNNVSDMCKAAVHQNEYRDWNPYIVVFPLNERHIASALTFAARHRLCISTAGTGHEYNSRNSCPTGGILIRTILLKDKAFVPKWEEDPTLAPDGVFKFGAGNIFSEMHAFSAEYERLIASGWCSTVGMIGWHLGGGHGPLGPMFGLGVDNLLEAEIMQIGRTANGQPMVHKKIVSRRHNPQLFWAMRGGGGGVWGIITSMTIRAHAVPDGGLSHVFMTQSGTFCPDSNGFGYEWLRAMWIRFSEWTLMLNDKVSTQPGFFINTTDYKTGGLCAVTWQLSFEYFYAGGQDEPDYRLFLDGLKTVLQVETVEERNFNSVYDYVLTMPANKFLLSVSNPLPASTPPSDAATGSQNSVFVSRQAMKTQFAPTMMEVLDICVASLQKPDPTSPDKDGYRCGFHFLYNSITGNLGSVQPDDTSISPGLRSGVLLWNARTLSTEQATNTVYAIGPNSYFSESSYVLHNWTTRYWGEKTYEQLLAIKEAHDPGNHFWCHHCVGDDPNDAYGDPLRTAKSNS
ncbi:hypothetical protein NliqN6_5451 [Naganishia liquefaciens]|uniref:FAD-binding PCMH-type domain-containing protein n=1 Tax=Naganishia liquefaciens TaxID=104408 RepID=A0A8H3YGR5_9TREE|nr:hypothetical protein NliqN6_5451 [Naganishia liquefaciens]